MRPPLLLFLCILAATARRASTLEPRDMSSKSPYHNQTSQQREQSPRTAPEPRSFAGEKCSPVSLTMLTRHGSRSADNEAKFTMPIEYLEQAERAAALTPAGTVALQNNRALASRLVNITWGGLSPLGHDELRALGNDLRPLKRTPCRAVATKSSTQHCWALVREERAVTALRSVQRG
jgi:hypothetical protein